MATKYKKLLSPIEVGKTGVILKNRMVCTASTPIFIQGPERYPAESSILYAANIARGGAAFVTCACVSADGKPAEPFQRGSDIPRFEGTVGHEQHFDLYDSRAQHYFAQLADAIHFYNSKAIMEIMPLNIPGYDISDDILACEVPFQGTKLTTGKEMKPEMFEQLAKQMSEVCSVLKLCGFDGVYIHMAYRLTSLGRSLSLKTNKRTDQYGGSLENRCRFPRMVCEEIKKRCGRRFLINASITAYDPDENFGWSFDDTRNFLKIMEHCIDFLEVRTHEIDPAHPKGFTKEHYPFTFMAEEAKKVDTDVLIISVGGMHNADFNEKMLEEEKADLIGMGRGWIANPDYIEKLAENHADEIVPCLRCNKCFRASNGAPFVSVCSVNPRYCMEHRLNVMIREPKETKKVAVIGGGPAGMEAAITAYRRGHLVTLYEKESVLGGRLNVADIPEFKWPIREYKNYLIKQACKEGFFIRLNTEVTPELLKKEGCDVIIVAIGADPLLPPIPGIQKPNVMTAVSVYETDQPIGQKVVIIGGGEIGVETGLYLNEKGHEVTIVEMSDMLASEVSFVHNYSQLEAQWKGRAGFNWHLNTRCVEIADWGICAEGPEGMMKLEADTVIVAAGMKARSKEAMDLAVDGVQTFIIGDSNEVGSIQTAIRSGFAIASSI